MYVVKKLSPIILYNISKTHFDDLLKACNLRNTNLVAEKKIIATFPPLILDPKTF